MFDLAIDSKLRGCDVVKITIGDLVSNGSIRNRATIIQQKTGRPVQFELLQPTRTSLLTWLDRPGGIIEEYAFPSRIDSTGHISTRQYARLVDEWVIAAMRADNMTFLVKKHGKPYTPAGFGNWFREQVTWQVCPGVLPTDSAKPQWRTWLR